VSSRSLRIRGFGVTVEVPNRVSRALRQLVLRRHQGDKAAGSAGATGKPVITGPPRVRVKPRDPELGVAFLRDTRPRSLTDLGATDTIDKTLVRRIEAHPWYHTIELPEGIVTPGVYDHRPLVGMYGLPNDLTDKSALDVGSADGFWAFELERRGARVTAVDIETTADLDLPPAVRRMVAEQGLVYPIRGGFELAHELLGSRVKAVNASVYELDPDRLGSFEFVHAGDILLHLRDPLRALERIRSVTAGEALLSDVFDPGLDEFGKAGQEVANYLGGWEGAAWWIPALSTLAQMIFDAGFSDVEVVTTYRLDLWGSVPGPWRAVVRARP
jgi:tRNA (mo5U34)-methyltransferase